MKSAARRTKPKLAQVDDFPYPPTNLLSDDGVPLESDWHRLAMNLLIEVVTHHLRGRQDYFVGGNMFIYFSTRQARDRDYRGPDFFYVNNANLNPPRPYWAIWDENGEFPDVIVELTSPSTAKEDHTTKKDIYQNIFHTHEYFIYDPDSSSLVGWRLIDGRYEPIQPDEEGRLRCEEFGLRLGNWRGEYLRKKGTYPRFYDHEGQLVLIDSEAQKALAESEKLRAESEKLRADAAEAELAKLKKQSAAKKKRKK